MACRISPLVRLERPKFHLTGSMSQSYDNRMANSPLTSRITHFAMVFLTVVNLLWIPPASCCCARESDCGKGDSACCGKKSASTDCGCCCAKPSKKHSSAKCSHCPSKKDNRTQESDAGTATCGTGSCNCEVSNSRPTPPVSASTVVNNDSSSPSPLFAIVEPRFPEPTEVENIELRNRFLIALERPVTIRFGVWRN